MCPQESHVLRWGAGVTVGALARGRSRESREKMKNSPWDSASHKPGREHMSGAVADPLPQWPLCQGREGQHSPASWGAQHSARRSAPGDVGVHGCERVHSLCICVKRCTSCHVYTPRSCLDCGCSLTWNLHIISNPECTARFKLLSPVKFCHMRWALSHTSNVSRDLLSSWVLKSQPCDKEV